LERGLACFRLLLDRADPNQSDSGRTMLHTVVAQGESEHAPYAEMLLDRGARTDIRDDLLKSTPLGWACRWGRVDLVKLYLKRGADPIEASAEPWATPRAWAEKMGHTEVLALLRKHGAVRP
jgi:ankyrin repeat protein